MTTITKQEFKALSERQGLRCVSLFLPTHREGAPVLNRQDSKVLKNLLGEIHPILVERGFSEKEAAELLDPAFQLLEDGSFWRQQTEGLAIFLTRNFIQTFSLPYSYGPFYYVSHEFYLKPLLPVLIENPEFYLLSLNFQEVRFFRGNKEGLKEIQLNGALPQRVEEVVGEDYRQSFLGFHSQQGGRSEAIFHGHGDWKEDKKDEILTFFRAIDKEIAQYLGGKTTPLIVASLDYLFPLYEQANTYPHLSSEHLSGNPEYLQSADLHGEALKLVRDLGLEKTRSEKKELFLQYHGTARATADIREIIPAALNGRVDTLFLDRGREFWGVYDKRDASLRMQEEQHLSNTSLTNLAAIAVYLNGGLVFLEEAGDLPYPESGMNALYRY